MLLTRPFRMAVILLLLAVYWGACERHREVEDLTLSLLSQLPVPDSFPVQGIVSGPDGAIILLSSVHSHILIKGSRDESFQEFGVETLVRPFAAAFINSSGTVEIVDQGLQAVLRLRKSSGSDTVLALQQRIVGVVHDGKRWILALEKENDLMEVSVLHGGHLTGVASFEGWVPANGHIRMAIGSDSLLVLLHDRGAKIRWTVLDFAHQSPRLRHYNRSIGPIKPRTDSLRSSEPLWASIALVPLGGGFLHTVADLRSDLRLLQIVDATGKITRERLLTTPLGFAAVDYSRQHLLGIRQLNNQTLVIYAFLWERRGNIQQNEEEES